MIRLIVMVSVLGLVACGGDKTSDTPAKTEASEKTAGNGDAAKLRALTDRVCDCKDEACALAEKKNWKALKTELRKKYEKNGEKLREGDVPKDVAAEWERVETKGELCWRKLLR